MILYLEIVKKTIWGQIREGLEYQTELGLWPINQWRFVTREVACLELYTGEHRSNVIRKEDTSGPGKKALEAMKTEDKMFAVMQLWENIEAKMGWWQWDWKEK